MKKFFLGRLCSCVLALGMGIALSSCSGKTDNNYTSLDMLNDPSVTIGVETGSSAMFAVEENLPEAQIKQFSDKYSGYIAVQEGKLDGFAFERLQMELAVKNGQRGVKLLDKNLGEDVDVAVGISPKSKIKDTEDKLNEFIGIIKEDGTLDEMYKRWVVDENEDMPQIELPANADRHLTVGTSGVVQPYSYYKGTELNGYDIELAYRFAQWLGTDVEFKVYNYDSIVAAALTGDVDCIMANLNVTPERLEKIRFSDPLYKMQTAVMVRDISGETASYDSSSGLSGNAKSSAIDEILSGFERTFVRESRWKLFVQGIGTTMFITVLSILFGTLLGFAVYMLCRGGNAAAIVVTRFFIWLIHGMPVVVLLMILYYIVFGNISISGVWVAVVGFTLTFGSAVCNMLVSGVKAVDKGQKEAAYALGYSDMQTFFKIILPQAALHFMPAYKTEIVSLIKATAVVGYIAVQDLTKMGDIVRSRTYEAFFPLIAVAVIYFVLAGILNFFVKRIHIKIDPKHRTPEQILKGVDTHDRN